MCSSWAFHVDDRSESSSTWDMLVTFSLPEFNLKKQMCSSWEFHVDDRSD
jgi:hypothetical protein